MLQGDYIHIVSHDRNGTGLMHWSMMLCESLSLLQVYVVIQGPAFEDIHKYGQSDSNDIAHGVSKYALIGSVMTVVLFVGYLIYMVCRCLSCRRSVHMIQ